MFEVRDVAADHVEPARTGTSTDTVATVTKRLAEGAPAAADTVWVVDDDGRLVGVVPVVALLRAAPETTLADLAFPPPASVDAQLDQEHVAHHAITHDLDRVPVTRDGRFVGVVPARVLLGVLHREHGEDLHRLVGISPEKPARRRRGRDGPSARNAWHRLPWLVVGLAGSLAAGGVMGSFEETLKRDVAVAFFVPAIVYIADAVGTQTEAIVIRGLATHPDGVRHAFLREAGTGAILGLVLGLLAGPAVAFGWGDHPLGLAVGVSVFVACSIATVIGMALPSALALFGTDPALGSGPLATVIQDVLSIVAYLFVVTAVLP